MSVIHNHPALIFFSSMCDYRTFYHAFFIKINTYKLRQGDYMEKKKNMLGPNIKYYRKKLGITQEELSARLQVQGISIDRTMIAKIENQTREIPDYEIIAIANTFKIDVNALFDDINGSTSPY